MGRFRLSPDYARYEPHAMAMGPAASPLKKIALFAICAMLICLAAGWMFEFGRQRSAELEPQTGPVLIAMQRLGQLHTVSFAMKDVLRQESQQEPEGWARNIPGVTGLVHWTTHNDALVVAQGSVEAGVDLSKLTDKDVSKVKTPDGKTVLRVHLPPVTVYPPNVTVHVENANSGAFWHDDNIVPKAQAQASRRFLDAAEQQNIRSVAQENAIRMLSQMQHTLGSPDIQFTF